MAYTEIDLSDISEVINDVYYPLLFDESKFIVMKGSAGSGKSVFAVQKIMYRVLTEHNQEEPFRVLVVRKVSATNRHTTFPLVQDVIKQWGLWEYCTVRQTDMTIEFPDFNASIIFMGIDDPEKVKSITGIRHVFIEEATDLKREDVTQLALRLRGQSKHYHQIMLCFNPVSENHWIKAEFFDQELDDVVALSTTYKDNRFLDDAYINTLEQRVKNNPAMYRVYVLGEWGQEIDGNEMYFNFKEEDAGEYAYDPTLPLHLSFDFNVVPYLTLLVFQVDGKEVYQIDEICAKHPDNTTAGACKLFLQRYMNHTAGVFVYGDPSGLRRDTREVGNDFSIIQRTLLRFRPKARVLKTVASVAQRVQWINSIIGGFEPIRFYIDKKCRNSINDMLFLKQAQDGSKLKKKEKDEITGERVETRGHTTDAMEYFFTQCFNTEWHKWNNPSHSMKIYSKYYKNELVY